MSYSAVVRELAALNGQHRMELGVARMVALSEALGAPHRKLRYIVHVAGTNGKGSAATKIASQLYMQGYSVGLYTSPHISTVRERIQLHQKEASPFVLPKSKILSKRGLEYFLPNILRINERIGASYFEVMTALAFEVFHQLKVDFSIVEVGMGGRLDATNILPSPELAVITSIGFDHMKFLGNSLEKIAVEKAGIIKKGCSVVIGPNVPVQTVQEIANERGARSFHRVSADLAGFEKINQEIAKESLRVLQAQGYIKFDDLIGSALYAKPSGRMQRISDSVIIDAGHNAPAIEKMLVELDSVLQKEESIHLVKFVCGFARDKDYKSCFKAVREFQFCRQVSRSIHFVQAKHYRAEEPHKLQECFIASSSASLEDFQSEISDVQSALAGRHEQTLVLVFGSLNIMHDAKMVVGYPLSDLEVDENDTEHITLNE